MGDVRDVESPTWNDYLAFFVIPSAAPGIQRSVKYNYNNAPMARFFGCAVAPLRMT